MLLTHPGISRTACEPVTNQVRETRELCLLAAAQALPAPVGEPAAVDGEGVAVNETAQLRVGEKRDGLGYVLGAGEAGHRDASLYIGVGVAAPGLVFDVHLGLDPAGTDGVYAHAATSPLGGQGSRQADQAVFARVVGHAIGDTEQPCHR